MSFVRRFFLQIAEYHIWNWRWTHFEYDASWIDDTFIVAKDSGSVLLPVDASKKNANFVLLLSLCIFNEFHELLRVKDYHVPKKICILLHWLQYRQRGAVAVIVIRQPFAYAPLNRWLRITYVPIAVVQSHANVAHSVIISSAIIIISMLWTDGW